MLTIDFDSAFLEQKGSELVRAKPRKSDLRAAVTTVLRGAMEGRPTPNTNVPREVNGAGYTASSLPAGSMKMPVQGLSLVGFMDRDEAHQHLTTACIVADPSEAALDAEWNMAKARLGAAVDRAGHPDILPIPPEHQQYIAELAQLQWVAPVLALLPGATFSLVEIDKLLAYQQTISNDRSNHHCHALAQPPSMGELLDVCLPKVQINEPITAADGGNSVLLKAESLNVRTQQAGLIGPSAVGILFGMSLPLVHVVRHNGRCYLHNGFHRALGVRRAGATHVPCLFRDVGSHEEAGIRPGATFPAALLESANPPTLEHFTQGRAYDVQMRRVQRYIHVSWAEYVMAAE